MNDPAGAIREAILKGLCVISARGGSMGLPGKNLRSLLGKPLIVWSIEQAMAAPEVDYVVVSTDSEAIAAAARAAGALVPFMRPAELATSEAGKFQVWQHALGACETHFGEEFEFFLDLDCTNPLRDVADISRAIAQFRAARERGVDAVFSVCEARKNPYFNMLEADEASRLKICKQPPGWIVRRQDAPRVLEHVASIYVLSPAYLRSTARNLLDGRTEGYDIGAEKSFDVDSELDFELIEFFLRRKLGKDARPFIDVAGKRVILVGATGVLGRFYAELLVREGCRAAIADRPGSDVLALGRKLGIPAGEIDVAREDQVVAGLAALTAKLGGVDAVISNAAVTSEGLMRQGDPLQPMEDAPLAMWQAAIDVNLTGTFLVAREGGKLLKAQNQGGSLINISSIYGVVAPDHDIYEGMPFRSFPAYSASKSGVIGLTRWLATWWAKEGIRVNCIAPGGVFNNHDPEFVRRYAEKTPLGRMAAPADIAGAVLYLISDASKYCTGQNIVIDGGFSSW